MLISSIINSLENLAPTQYQESYDNCGLLVGNAQWVCTGVLCTLDVTEAIVLDAKSKNCNLIVAHHPIIFSGLKKITGKNYMEKTVIAAIKNDIAIYAIHTNLDNVQMGVNKKIADKLSLINQQILLPKNNQLCKLVVFVPKENANNVKEVLFAAGAGNISNYSECSFSTNGIGTFKGNEFTDPKIGKPLVREYVEEIKLEVILPNYLQHYVIAQMKKAHPYEEVAYDIFPLNNISQNVGSGMMGELKEEISEHHFLQMLKQQFELSIIKHTALLNKPIKKVAVCGGAGSFLIKDAIAKGADVFVSSDIKYHEFFDAESKIVVADIGHWESEQFTIELLMEHLQQNFPTFAVLKSEISTNPVHIFID